MTDRATWRVTTHDWVVDLDEDHLKSIQKAREDYVTGGRRHLILEVLAYADDEARALGRVGLTVVKTSADGVVSVTDNGRGTDTRIDAEGLIVRKAVMSTKDVRFFDSAEAPQLPDGLPRRGISTVAALSSMLVHENHRANGSWSQRYRHGIPDVDLQRLPPQSETGTRVAFKTDLGEPRYLIAADFSAFPWLRIQFR
jgi:topoisomerase-4 subunit B